MHVYIINIINVNKLVRRLIRIAVNTESIILCSYPQILYQDIGSVFKSFVVSLLFGMVQLMNNPAE